MKTWSVILGVFVLLCAAMPAGAQTLGMVADDGSNTVTVFNADTNTVLGVVPIAGSLVGDCVMLHDQSLGFVTDFTSRVWVIDLTVPGLAAGTNPISVSNVGEDLAITLDQKFLILTDGFCPGGNCIPQPISVIDIASRSEVSTFSTGAPSNSVDVCADGSVLITSLDDSTVRRFTIDAAGTLTDTGDLLSVNVPNNVICSPSGTSGVVIRRSPPGLVSFTIPGLNVVSVRNLSDPIGLCMALNFVGSRLYARSTGGGGKVDMFTFNSATGALGVAPINTITVGSQIAYFGMDQMALHPNETKLYVSSSGTSLVRILDPVTLGTIGVLPATFTTPTGICFASPDESGPLAVDLLSFRGNETSGGMVNLSWETASETDSAGFNLYREPWKPDFSQELGTDAVQLNRTLIPAQGSQFQGATYEFSVLKLPHQRPARYWLEEVDIFGNRQLERPISARPAAPHTPPVR